MSELKEMVYSACLEWFNDWVSVDPPTLHDEWDLAQWMDNEMKAATEVFIRHAFHSARARNDAIMILRALYYEYFLFEQQRAITNLKPNLEVVASLPIAPQTSQKSAAWHAESRNMLSGHEFGGICVGGPAERNTVLAKKCAPELVVHGEVEPEAESRIVFLTDSDGKLSPFKWGWRYEPVARQLFETVVAGGAPVYDGLGRIRHPTLPRLGASPDGLIMGSTRAGRLVEIKCPVTRELDGKIPIRYYCQMQLQAEVCNVDAVDYIEVQFAAAPAETVTEDIIKRGKQPWIGKVCVTASAADADPASYKYDYSPLFPATKKGYSECLAWKPYAGVILEESVWYVKDWFTTTVLRNKRWWQTIGYPAYVQFWEDADAARADGRFKSQPLFVESDSDGEAKPVWEGSSESPQPSAAENYDADVEQ